MDAVITPSRLGGAVNAPPSKSAAHRLTLCAALAHGTSRISPIAPTEDMHATIQAAAALGATLKQRESTLLTQGVGGAAPAADALLDCGESGSTLRFFIPVAATLGASAVFTGRGRLPKRPLTPLLDALSSHGVRCTAPYGDAILRIQGKLLPGAFTLPGNVSSQYITGLLLALPLLDGDSEIRLSSPLESVGYVNMTLEAMSCFGVSAHSTGSGWRVPGGQRYRSGDHTVEGDYSNAAPWLCAGAIAGPVTVKGLSPASRQGDRAVLELLRRFGARVEADAGAVTVSPGGLRGIDIDASQIPDLVPVLAAVAAVAAGTTLIHGAARLRIKESDRLQSTTTALRALGADVEERADSLVVTGRQRLRGGVSESFSDHRIAMALSVAALGCEGQVTITGAHCVAKSYPDFFKEFASLGGLVHVV